MDYNALNAKQSQIQKQALLKHIFRTYHHHFAFLMKQISTYFYISSVKCKVTVVCWKCVHVIFKISNYTYERLMLSYLFPRGIERYTNMALKMMSNIVWRNVIILAALHIGSFYGVYLKWLGVHLYSRIFFWFYCHLGGIGVTAGRHRYFSHRAFKGNRFVDILLVLLASTAFEQSILTWCRDHRLHHKHSETDADPYNSNRGFFFCHMGWMMERKHKDVKEKGKTIDMSDLKDNPVVMFEHKYCLPLALVFTIALPTMLPWYFWNESLMATFFYCTLYRFVVILHITWSVNSVAHMFGMRHYDKSIRPVESGLVSTMSLGEGFHNYHHTFPWDYKAGELGNDTRNVTTWFIDMLAMFGMVTERKTVSQELVNSRIRRTGNPKENRTISHIKNILGYILFIAIMF